MELPETLTAAGLATRPLTVSDAMAVHRVMAIQEVHDLGSEQIELADILADWQRPSFDVFASTIGVWDGETLIAYAEVSGGSRGDAAVHPAYRGRGIGTFLALWMQDAARRHGYTSVRMPVPEDSAGDRLLADLGYSLAWTSWVLNLPAGGEVERRALPEGYALRTASPENDEEVWNILEDAFLEWSVRDRESFEDFQAHTRNRPGFEPWNLRVTTDPSGVIVAALIVLLAREGDHVEGYIDRIAVRRDQRGQGIAQAMIAEAFRQGREHGAVSFGLSTDSRTGALGLYEKVGMRVTSVWVNRAIHL